MMSRSLSGGCVYLVTLHSVYDCLGQLALASKHIILVAINVGFSKQFRFTCVML